MDKLTKLKRYGISLILFSIIGGCSSNEEEPTLSCGIYEGQVYLKSQSEVEEFGKCNYTEINGGLRIEDRDSNSLITDLSSLNSLTLIRGGIDVSNTRELKTLEGLNNAFSNQVLFLSENKKLENIDGLDKMQPDNLQISKNKALQNLNALNFSTNSITTIAINECPLLKNLNCFSNITDITHYLALTNNIGLEELNGLHNVESIGIQADPNVSGYGAIQIKDNPSLKTLDQLSGLTAIHKGMFIARNNSLATINGLANVATYSGNLIIRDNPNLSSVDGLSLIKDVKNLEISNTKIQDLNGLSGLEFIRYDLLIAGNPFLTDFCGLLNLVEVNGVQGLFDISFNAYNPTSENITNGYCRQ